MNDDDFKLFRGFGDRLTNGRTDICECRVAFATENMYFIVTLVLNFLLLATTSPSSPSFVKPNPLQEDILNLPTFIRFLCNVYFQTLDLNLNCL